MKKFIPVILPCVLILATGSCKKYDGEKASSQREDWIASLHDSIALITGLRQEDSVRINNLREDLDARMKNFTQVANQREVAPYYILSTVRSDYPLTSTGVIARITNDMQFEVIAALSTGKFDAIRFSMAGTPAENVTSAVVPPDQALNYTSADGLTVVAFSGELNSPLGEFVAKNSETALNVEYLMNGTVRKSIPLGETRKKCIAQTWQLTSSRSMLDSLEAVQIINARKLEILHITLSRQEDRKIQEKANNPDK
ncbi:MAG: hypothetical protein K2J15_02000 [Muribaculaceae bacterium]|nr:hypothetical protein [Muribaculaceae bacterium]